MPKQLVLSSVPVDLSIVECDLDRCEDVFLTYTYERQRGPGICRTGKGPPYMDLIGGAPGATTTHAFGLRLGTWLIQEELRQAELDEARRALAQARRQGRAEPDIDVLERTIRELPSIRAHDTVFGGSYPGYEIVVHQGCGDLTMNAWNVAYFNSQPGQDRALEQPITPQAPALVSLPGEPVQLRAYSCLVKWKGSEAGLGRLTIEEVRFRHQWEVTNTNEMVWIQHGDRWLPRGDRIDFAVSNQQVIRRGEIVPVVTNCHQFGDIRHLLQLPNLNPVEQLHTRERPHGNGEYRPRDYFNLDQHGDIWFGESHFLEDTSGNLLRGALAGPVFLSPLPGATHERIRGALGRSGYREAVSATQPLAPGMWRSVRRTLQEDVVEIYFKRNTYAWSMIGLSSDTRRVLCLACGGNPGAAGYTLEQAAEVLRQAGAWNALLMDEGADVFQKLRRDDGRMADAIPGMRRRVRSTIIVAQPLRHGGHDAHASA